MHVERLKSSAVMFSSVLALLRLPWKGTESETEGKTILDIGWMQRGYEFNRMVELAKGRRSTGRGHCRAKSRPTVFGHGSRRRL